MINKESKNVTRQKRHLRIRKNISGTPEKPRLNVFRSNKQIYAQIIDDVNGVTLCSASSCDEGLNITNGGNVAAAFATVSLPFIIGDIIKCVMSSIVGVSLNKVIT